MKTLIIMLIILMSFFDELMSQIKFDIKFGSQSSQSGNDKTDASQAEVKDNGTRPSQAYECFNAYTHTKDGTPEQVAALKKNVQQFYLYAKNDGQSSRYNNDKDLSYVATLANNLIDDAYATVKQSPQKAELAVGYAESAKMLCAACLFILPGNEKVKSIEADAEKAAKKIGEGASKASAAAMKGMSEFHKAHLGKVLFLKTPVAYGQEKDADVTAKFTANDKIYMRAYLKGAVKDVIVDEYNRDIPKEYTVRAGFDGAKPIWRDVSAGLENTPDNMIKEGWVVKKGAVTDKNGALPYIDVVMLASPKEAPSGAASVRMFAGMLTTLSPRRHTVRIEVGTNFTVNGESPVIAAGEFEIDLSEGADKVAAYAGAAAKAADANAAAADLQKADLPEPGRANSNAKVVAEITKQLKDSKISPMRVVVTYDDWEVYKDSRGKIEGMYMEFCVAYKEKDGNCYFRWGTFTREYFGGGKYGNPEIGALYDRAPTPIKCDRVK